MNPALLAGLGLAASGKLMDFGLNSLGNFQSGIWNRDNTAYLQQNATNEKLRFIQNSPQAYVSGLEQAGLNPMLAYSTPSQSMSSSSASNGVQSSQPSSGNTGKELFALIKFLKAVKNL